MDKRMILFIGLFFGCVPRIDRGPVPFLEAAKPVRILQMKDDQSPNLYLQAVIHAGSRMDGPGKEGLAYLTARSMAEGGGGSHGPDEIRQKLYPTGNDLQVLVNREYVSLRLRCHKDHAQSCADTFLSVLTQPQFNEDTINRIRSEALYAVTDGLLGDEEALGNEALNNLLFEGHPYGHPVSGRGGTIDLLSSNDVRAFYKQHYVRSSVYIGIGGAYDDGLYTTLEQGLQTLSTHMPPDTAMQSPVPIDGRQLLVVSTETPVTGFHVGHLHGVTRANADWPALYLGAQALGAHRQSSGRLFESLRTQRGLNYGDYAYIEAFQQRGWSTFPEQGALLHEPVFYLWLRPTSVENGPFALKLAIDELENWVEKGLSPDEFENVKQFAMGHLPLEAQNIGRQMAYALEARVSGMPNLLETLPATLNALTLEEVNAAIQRHITPKNLAIVAVSGEGSGLVEKLRSEAITPIQYANVTPSKEQAEKDDGVSKKDLQIEIDGAEVREAKGLFR